MRKGLLLPTRRRVALALLSDNLYDLALIDVSLLDGNGISVCTEIKEVQDIPVIFLTASGDEASVVTVDTASGIVKKDGLGISPAVGVR